jgi:hypothetical protein
LLPDLLPAAAFDIQAVTLQPEVVPPGGSLRLVVDVLNKAPAVTAGDATIRVYYYGWWVLTASGTMCEAPPTAGTPVSSSFTTAVAHRRSLLGHSSWASRTQLSSAAAGAPCPPTTPADSSSSSAWQWQATALCGGTCQMPAGPLTLHHDASLPAVAPRGKYRMDLSAADVNSGQELFCLSVYFKVAS